RERQSNRKPARAVYGVDDDLGIDGLVNRLAHTNIVEGRLVHPQADLRPAEPLGQLQDDIGFGPLQILRFGQGDVCREEDLQVPGSERSLQRLEVGDANEVIFVDIGPTLDEEVGITAGDACAVLVDLLPDEGTGTDEWPLPQISLEFDRLTSDDNRGRRG